MTDRDDEMLDALFHSAREARAGAASPEERLPSALMARILADAEQEQRRTAPQAATPGALAVAEARSWFASLKEAFTRRPGGWQAAGLVMAAATGLAIGLTLPERVGSLAGYESELELATGDDPFYGFEILLAEG